MGRFWLPFGCPSSLARRTFFALEIDLLFSLLRLPFWSPPSRPKRCPRGLQEAPKRPQERSKRPPEAPRRLQETTRAGQEGSGHSKNALLRCPATKRRAGMAKAGGRAAVSPQRGRQSAATRRVGACLDRLRISLSNSSNSKSQARPRAFRRADHLISKLASKSVQNRSKNRSNF